MRITCKACKHWRWCMERSRMIPCTAFKRKSGMDDEGRIRRQAGYKEDDACQDPADCPGYVPDEETDE